MNIIVPTDFSDHANHALDYAIDIINQLGGQILLYHAYQVKSTTGTFISMERFLREDAEKDLEATLRRVQSRLNKRAGIQSKLIRGDTVSLIADTADHRGFDLIVMGTQGASGLKEIFIGSTTAGVMSKTKTPILAIPNDFKYRPIRKMVLAVDNEAISNENVLSVFLELAKGFNAKISVFHLRKEVDDTGIDPSVDQFISPVPYGIHHYMQSNGINAGINEFVGKNNADLLCMFRRKRSFLEEVFHSSVTRKEMFDSPVPLLILQD